MRLLGGSARHCGITRQPPCFTGRRVTMRAPSTPIKRLRKAAKALLYKINEAPWGNSVRILLERFLTRVDSELKAELLACARELDRHYIPSRHPNAHPAGTSHEAYDEESSRRALEAARKKLEYAEKVIRGGS